MKKKLIAIAIAAAVAAPLTAQAAATISGDAEFEMTNYSAAGLLGGPEIEGWNGNNRVRVKVDADLGGGVGVHTRIKMSTGDDALWQADYAYMTAKVGPASLTMGDQLATWGTKVFIEGSLKHNRLVAAFKPSNTLTAKIIMDPYYKGAAAPFVGAPKMGLAVVSKLSNMMTAGLLYTQGVNGGDSSNNVFAKGQMSGITFGIESQSTADDRANYVMAGMKAGGADLALHYVTNKTADADWSPVGVINGSADLVAAQTDITMITAGMKAGGMNVTAGIGQAGDGTTNESMIGLDLGKKMGAADFVFSYGSHDSETAYGFKFKTKF